MYLENFGIHLMFKNYCVNDWLIEFYFLNRVLDLHEYLKSIINEETNLSTEEKCEMITKSMPHTERSDIDEIEKLTINQSKDDLWYKARRGRVTASRCHEVMTRMETLAKDNSQNCDNLLKRILYPSDISTPAMQIGRRWEDKGFMKYKSIVEKEGHINLKVKKCGLIVGTEIYMGASPDGLVSCNCHGEGILEIKCASKFWAKDPNDIKGDLPYIRQDEMNKSHKYYSQVQFQMGITNRKWGDFVVFTGKCVEDDIHPLILRIDFDKVLFDRLVTACTTFWFRYMLVEMIDERLKDTGSADVHKVDACMLDHLYHMPINRVVSSVQADHVYTLPDIDDKLSEYNCPMCHQICKDENEVKTFHDRSIGCDMCNAWFHFECTNMTQSKLEEIGEGNWYCVICAKKAN